MVGRIPPSALLDLHRLATLREVARCGSYAAAAEALSYTPSAVSQQMAGLSRDLGSRLFERTPRGMRLTAVAELLVVHIDLVFARLNDAQAELEAASAGVSGRLLVGSFPTATVGFLAEELGRFQLRFPRVDVTLADGEPYESIARLKARDLDLAAVFDFDHRALSADYDGRQICQDSEIESVELFDDPFLVVLPREHPLAKRDRIENAELAGERILGGPAGCSPWETDLREACRRAGFDAQFEARYRTVDFAAQQAIVATGRGITLVPELAHLPSHANVVTRRLVDGPVRHVRIAWLAGVPLSAAGTAMVELLRHATGELRSVPLELASAG